MREIVELRRRGFRFVALADDNFYPVTLTDLAMAQRRADKTQYETLRALRAERFELMERLAQLPDDMVFYTQITMEAAEDPEFLDGDGARADQRRAGRRRSRHARGVEGRPQELQRRRASSSSIGSARSAITASTCSGRSSSACRAIGAATFDATVAIAERADITFAQFLMLTPFPGTTDFARGNR